MTAAEKVKMEMNNMGAKKESGLSENLVAKFMTEAIKRI